MSERFRVGSVTGWKINQANPGRAGDQRHVPTTIWYVHDSACGYAIMREFLGGSNQRVRRSPEGAARAYAAKLNREYP